MCSLDFKGLPENIEGLKEIALAGKFTHPSAHQLPASTLRAGLGQAGRRRCGSASPQVSSSSRAALLLGCPVFCWKAPLGHVPSLSQAAFPERNPGPREEQRARRNLDTSLSVKSLAGPSEGHSHLFPCAHQGPSPANQSVFSAKGKLAGGKNKFLFALEKG